jgi:hypothetical protein
VERGRRIARVPGEEVEAMRHRNARTWIPIACAVAVLSIATAVDAREVVRFVDGRYLEV